MSDIIKLTNLEVNTMLSKGTYVRIRKHLLMPNERIQSIPNETRKEPLKMWVKGRLNDEAEMFEKVCIVTASDRIECGTLKEKHPKIKHGFGEFVEEIITMRESILSEFWGIKDEE